MIIPQEELDEAQREIDEIQRDIFDSEREIRKLDATIHTATFAYYYLFFLLFIAPFCALLFILIG